MEIKQSDAYGNKEDDGDSPYSLGIHDEHPTSFQA
jgi:hypothetical protein